MPNLTDDEIKTFASNIVSLVLASLLDSHPRVAKAINGLDGWSDTVDELIEQTTEAMIRRLNP